MNRRYRFGPVLSTDLLPEAAIVLDADGRVSAANAHAAACFGRALEGCELGDLVREPQAVLRHFGASNGDRWQAQLEGVRADGVPFPLDVAGRVIADGQALLLLRDRNADESVPGI